LQSHWKGRAHGFGRRDGRSRKCPEDEKQIKTSRTRLRYGNTRYSCVRLRVVRSCENVAACAGSQEEKHHGRDEVYRFAEGQEVRRVSLFLAMVCSLYGHP